MIEFVGSLNEVFQYLSGQAVWWGLLLLAVAAIIEYVFPPFPGDTVTVAGAVLVPQAGWPILGVFGAVLAGTAVGIAIDWRVGLWLAGSGDGDTWLHRWLQSDRVEPKLEKLNRQFERWGSVYIALNRFVPAFRALFFLAAGHARLHLGNVLFFGCLSAALYNAALLAVGYSVGYKLEELAMWVDSYSRIVLIGLGVLVALWALKKGYDWFRS